MKEDKKAAIKVDVIEKKQIEKAVKKAKATTKKTLDKKLKKVKAAELAIKKIEEKAITSL